MTDPRETPDRAADLLVPDHRVMSLDEARAEKQAPRKTGRSGDWVTRGDFDKWMTRAVTDLNAQVGRGLTGGLLALGQKLYDQWGEETAANLEQMEVAVYRRVWAQIENDRRERSWRRRARRWLARLGWPEQGPALALDDETQITGFVHEQPDEAAEALMRESEDAALSALKEAQLNG